MLSDYPLGTSLLSWQDKFSFAFRKAIHNEDWSTLLTARLTLWAQSNDELQNLLKDQSFSKFKQESDLALDPIIAEREWKVGFIHNYSHKEDGINHNNRTKP